MTRVSQSNCGMPTRDSTFTKPVSAGTWQAGEGDGNSPYWEFTLLGIHPIKGDEILVTVRGGSAKQQVSDRGGDHGRWSGAAADRRGRTGDCFYRRARIRRGSGRRWTRMAHAERRPGPGGGKGRRAVGSQLGRGRLACRAIRAQQVRRRDGGTPVARVPPPVHRPDADRPAGGRRGEPFAAGVGDRHRPACADAVQRGSRPAAGREGRGGRRRPAEDDDHQGQGDAGRPAAGDSRRATRSRQHRRARGGRRRARRREAAARGDDGGRGVRADRGEPAGIQGHGAGRGHRHAAGRPVRHGVHEHQRHPRRRRVRRHRDRDGDRGRPHLSCCHRCRTSCSSGTRRAGFTTGSRSTR